MIFQATKEIEQALTEHEINCHIVEEETASRVIANYKMEAGNRISVQFISNDDSNAVAIRIFEFAHTDAEHRAALLEAVNEMNVKYRFVKFVLDKDDDVCVELDIPVSAQNLGEMAHELLARTIVICDDVYPGFMKAIWN